MSESNPNQPSMSTDLPWKTQWPASELEHVSVCPVCGSSDRTVLHKELIDNVFFVAQGQWTLYSCSQCASAYLDPRPNQISIGKAYGTYYTHVIGTSRDSEAPLAGFGRLRREMSNGYLNRRYGTKWQPASNLGYWLAKFFPGKRQVMDAEFRYLPKPIQGQRLLDIGCGNGEFLVGAKEAGWQVLGLEPDPIAAATSQKRGIDVLVGSIEDLSDESSCFDAVTLGHVIEHVHEPRKFLLSVYRLLKPGGVVYIETPNINSWGAHAFGKNWRGLEPPRHLVLFTPKSLSKLLLEFDFQDIKMERRSTLVRKGMYLRSLRMAAGYSPYGQEELDLGWRDKIKLKLLISNRENSEFITLTAKKGIHQSSER